MFSIGLEKRSKLAPDPGLGAFRQQSVFGGNRRCPSQLSAAESIALHRNRGFETEIASNVLHRRFPQESGNKVFYNTMN
jgi:hypothetical protein